MEELLFFGLKLGVVSGVLGLAAFLWVVTYNLWKSGF